MNTDLLENNPAWTTYIYFAGPMFVLIMLAVLLLKRKGLFVSGWRYLQTLRAQVMKGHGNPPDFEIQSGGPLEAVGNTGDRTRLSTTP